MLEIFVFVNPIGNICLEVEKNLLALAGEQSRPVQIKFVPTLNFTIITDYMKAHAMDPKDLELRNHLFNLAYNIILDYKAAQFQGNLKARKLLMALQRAFNEDQRYDRTMVAELLATYHIDQEMFDEDRTDAALRDAFSHDQQLASEMHITNTPSAVFMDTDQPETDAAILLENVTDHHVFANICHELVTRPAAFYGSAELGSLNGTDLHVL